MKSLFSYTLKVMNGEAAGKEWRLFQEVVTLGRHEANHLVFKHPTISKQQCRILVHDGQLRLENLSKSNKTLVNGAAVDAADLQDADLIQIGDIEVHVTTHQDQVTAVAANALADDPPTAAIQFNDGDVLPVQADEKPSAAAPAENKLKESAPADSAETAGQYTIESKIAQSGQAILFKGRNEANGETVALKLFTHDEADEVSEARFQRELKILKKLSHRNIVEYRGLFETEGEWGDSKRYLVMEFLEGKTLSELIREHPKGMDWETVRSIFEQCLSGLLHASKEHKIIHRDLKPSNIFVLEDGTAKLIDFGISRFDSESTHTGGSGMMGSFDYMAPDFARAEDEGFRGDIVSDIFSLFVCMYHALTGKLPYPKYGERQELEYLNRWRSSEIKPPSHKHIIFRVIAHLSSFIDQGLAVDSSKRFQTFQEVLDALEKLKNRTVVHKKVDSYELLTGLGAGGFGEVYLGKRKSDGVQVAIKRLHSGRSSKRFIKEAMILSEYEHPALVKYLDFFETGSSSGGRSPFLVLEYLEGTTLNKQVAAHPEGMDTKEVLLLFLRYLSALDFLHNAKGTIIHRDIKPGNLHVPLEDPTQAKIFDLGIVKDLSGTQTSGKLPGTYYYMAPEMFTTDNRGTCQTDVYALGLCFYEALTGKPAYPRLPKNDKEAIMEMIARAQGEKQLRVSYNHRAFRDHPDIVHIVQTAINADPNARYADAGSMLDEITSVLEVNFKLEVSSLGEGMQAVPAAAGTGGPAKAVNKRPPVRKKRRGKALAASLGVILVLAAGGIAAARSQREKLEPVVDTWPEPIRDVSMLVLNWPVEPLEPEAAPLPAETPEPEPVELVVEEPPPAVEPLQVEVTNVVYVHQKEDESSLAKSDFDKEMDYLQRGQIDFGSFKDGKRSISGTVYSYNKDIEKKFIEGAADNVSEEDAAYFQQACKSFWAVQLGAVLDGYKEKQDGSLLALANGAYLFALHSYSKVMDVQEIGAVQAELENRMAAQSESGGLNEFRKIFPVLQTGGFSVNRRSGTGESAWWQKYAPKNPPERFHALYLPLRAEKKITIFHGQTTTIPMDFVLVPFNMLNGSVRVQGRALSAEPINPFYMASAETTAEQMQAFYRDSGRSKNIPGGPGAEKPYSEASLEEAVEFCNWLSRQDGLEPVYELKKDGSGWNLDLRRPGYRMPFDFEWEYAARFGFDYFPKSGESNWKAMQAELDKKVEDQVSEDEINGGLVNFYYQQTMRMPSESSAYPLGMYDLCGNAPEICMTAEELPHEPDVVEVEFMQMFGGEMISNIEAVAPWLSNETPDEVHIRDREKAAYGFRVVRSVPVYLFE